MAEWMWRKKGSEHGSSANVGLDSDARVLIWIVSGATVALLAFCTWFFTLRDTWEADHRDEVARLSTETISSIDGGNQQQGLEAYRKLTALLGKRTLRDAELHDAFAGAKAKAESLMAQLDAERLVAEKRHLQVETAIEKLRGLESKAQAFINIGDFQPAIDAYQQALDLIKVTQADNADLAVAASRILRAKTSALAKLDQNKAEAEKRARAAKEQARRDAEEAKIPEITIQQLQILGEKYAGKRVRITGISFGGAGNTFVDWLPGVVLSDNGLQTVVNVDEMQKWVNFSVFDADLHTFSFAFVLKDKYGEKLAAMKEFHPISIHGYVIALRTAGDYGIVCDRIDDTGGDDGP